MYEFGIFFVNKELEKLIHTTQKVVLNPPFQDIETVSFKLPEKNG